MPLLLELFHSNTLGLAIMLFAHAGITLKKLMEKFYKSPAVSVNLFSVPEIFSFPRMKLTVLRRM